MWFKNLTLFRLTEPFTLSAAELHSKLETLAFRPCGKHEPFSAGWTPPLGTNSEQLVHSNNGFLMICLKKQEKVLPASVVNEICAEKIIEQEQQQARKFSRKERSALKDEVIFELLPQAFCYSKRLYAYIDAKGGWIVVDSASANKAEDLISLLRQALDSLPVSPPVTNESPVAVMTQWLNSQKAPSDIIIEDECELRSEELEGGIIRCKRHDLSLPEIQNHLNSGKKVQKLAVNWADRLAFVVDENLAIKRLRFLDLIQDQLAEYENENEQEQFDVDFSIMSSELAGFLPRLLELFGGENR